MTELLFWGEDHRIAEWFGLERDLERIIICS